MLYLESLATARIRADVIAINRSDFRRQWFELKSADRRARRAFVQTRPVGRDAMVGATGKGGVPSAI